MEAMNASVSLTVRNGTPGTAYARSSLMDLIRRIVRAGDEHALREFLEHRCAFRWGAGPAMRLPEYVFALRNASLDRPHVPGRRMEVVDRAYDLTLDKFSRLPSQDCGERVGGVKPKGTDCRYYYKAFFRFCSSRLDPQMTLLRQEASLAPMLQRFVVRHYYLSLTEAARQTATVMHRYTWKTRGVSLCLYMPRAMDGREKRAWLDANIAAEDLGRPDARTRVQAIIDERLRPLYSGMPNEKDAFSEPSLPGVSIRDFAHAIAEEKASGIQNLRPSIRVLGPDKLRRFILDIFERLKIGSYDEQMLARQYGLSKSSFSRFAGSRWSESDDETKELDPPDLWRNMARLLGERSDFVEAAKDAGVLDRVTMVAVREPQLKEGDNQ